MTNKNKDDGYRVVFSTDAGAMCSECERPVGRCECAARARSAIVGDGQIRVRRETKGRGGKTVTTITGMPINSDQLAALGKELKRACGTGGAVKDGIIEVQGDHSDTVMKELEKRGFKPKRSGG